MQRKTHIDPDKQTTTLGVRLCVGLPTGNEGYERNEREGLRVPKTRKRKWNV